MSDTELPSSMTQSDARSQLEALSRTGRWMAWAGLGCAVLWWGGFAGVLIGLFGFSQILAQPTGLLIAASMLIVLPGLMMIMAGLMAQQGRRASQANALVLQAADGLLAPANTAEQEIARLAEATRTYTQAINQTATETLSSLKATSDALANERLRVESVTYAMADNTRDLTHRLKDERLAIESIAKSLDLQSRSLADAIPRQAAAIADAAKQAGEEVAETDAVLEKQLHNLKHAGSTLAVRLSDLETVAKDAASRTEALNQSLARIEDKLGQSQKTVEMAEKASTMAVDAATGVGHALRDAVSAALDSARDANPEIAQTTRKVHEDAARTLAELKRAGDDARGSALAPPVSAPKAADTPAPAPEPALRRQAERPAPEFPLRARHKSGDLPPPSAPTAKDEDLFDAEDPPIRIANGHDTSPPPAETVLNGSAAAALNGHDSQASTDRTEWRDIIADLEQSDAPTTPSSTTPLPREETAQTLMDRLQESGIALPRAFRPKDKKKIAVAAQRDESARRDATRSAAGGEVNRVAVRLRKDADLKRLAQHFVIAEEEDALKALNETGKTRRPPSLRLSAYLLVDAALEQSVAD